ncbi:MAG: DUF4177 domain-containing protein [Dehalococcoidia bacterium]
MTAWQHAWISVDPMKPEDHTKLEAFGKEGWELVSVMPWGATPSIFLMFFKRPVPDMMAPAGYPS